MGKKGAFKVKVVSEVKARQIFQGKVTRFGTGAHIIFPKDQIGKAVIVIPVEEE